MTLQPAALVAPDAELLLTGYLRDALAARTEPYAASVYVSNRKPPANRPRTVVVRRDGGSQRGVFDFPRVAVRVWADKEQDASDLARLVQALLLDTPGSLGIAQATSLSGPSPIEDPSQHQRYLTLEFRVRCQPL